MTRGSRFALFVLILCLSAFSLGPTSAQAVTLLVNGSGILTGATGVDVGGTLYDVEFLDGSCVALFDGCDADSDFTFQTQAAADAASQALLAQVLLDGALGHFDTNPTLTRGCNDPIACNIHTPYDYINNSETLASVAINAPQPSAFVGINNFLPTQDSNTILSRTYAHWAPVPEPSTPLLFGLGLAALGLWDYRQRQRRRTGTPHP